MKTVLHLINTGGPGGAETVYVDLVRQLDPSRWRSVVVLPNREWMYDQLQDWNPAPVVLRHEGRLDLSYLWRLVKLIRRHKVDLIHAHFFASSEIASLLGILLGVPAVATLHGHADIAGGRRMRLKVALLNRGLRRMVLVSQSLRQFFLEETDLWDDNMVVIPNGADPHIFVPHRNAAVRREIGLSDEHIVVGSVGNLRAAKGYDVLLRAAALLKERNAGYRFVIVGQAQGALYEDLLRLRSTLGLDREVIFTGFRDDVSQLLSGFDLYAITSRSEGFSISTVQAMLAGLPIVATRCGGPEEILEHGVTGLLVANESPEAVAEAISRLLSDERQRARLSEHARFSAQARFSIHTQVKKYEHAYTEVIEQTRHRKWSLSGLIHRRFNLRRIGVMNVR